MKTGLRLQNINAMLENNYTHIWDCCCDHGLLGMSILKRQIAHKVHFVDIVENITEQVQAQLEKYFNSPSFKNKWQVHCIDVAKLPLSNQLIEADAQHTDDLNTAATHLIIIAGVGGDLLIEFVQSIVKDNPSIKLEFILCPVHHNYKVRKALIALNFNLINEAIVYENKRFYEVLHVIINAETKEVITDVGSKMWDLSNGLHQQYLRARLKHYRRMQSNPRENVDNIIKAYQALKA